MNKWSEFYKDRVNSDSYLKYFKEKYSPFLTLIKEHWEVENCEDACGIGMVSKALDGFIPDLMLDNDNTMLELCKQNYVDKLAVLPPYIMQHDIRSPDRPECDLIYSHGVLEHFSDFEIHKIIRAQRKNCRVLLHYVPTDKYEVPSYGDERLLNSKKWVAEFKPTEYHLFNDGYDLALIWRK